jgi:hypothetical protein
MMSWIARGVAVCHGTGADGVEPVAQQIGRHRRFIRGEGPWCYHVASR